MGIKGKALKVFSAPIMQELGILPFLLAAVGVAFAVLSPHFATVGNGLNVLQQSSFLIILAMGQLFALLVGGLDISIGVLIPFVSVITALTMKLDIVASEPAMVALGVLAGGSAAAGIGLANGSMIARIGVSPFITTLGLYSILSGAAFVISGEVPVFGLPPFYNQFLGKGEIGPFPISVVVMIVIGTILYILMNWTKVGRYFWAIGGNINAAVLSGIPIRKYTTLAYVLCSTLAGIAAILLSARAGSGELTLGLPLMLQAIAAAVLGGASVGGGRGNIPGVILGAFFVVMLMNGMNLIEMGSFVQQITLGAFLILGIVVDRLLKRARGEREILKASI
jgi:ribose transport system permease protein